MASKRGTRAIRESKRFAAKREDRSAVAPTRRRGRSKYVLFILTDFSARIFIPKRTSETIVIPARKICLGISTVSVVAAEKTRGKARKRIPMRKRVVC